MSWRKLVIVAAAVVLSATACGSDGGKRVWPEVTYLPDRSSVSVTQDGHVTLRDRYGREGALSWCESYERYRGWVSIMSAFRTAVLSGDRAGAAAHVAYPLRWNHGHPTRSTMIRDRRALLTNYSAIFADSIVDKIRAADPRALFCRNYTMAMLGNGVVWGGEDRPGHSAIVSINGSD